MANSFFQKPVAGYIIVVIGLILILLHALDYIFGIDVGRTHFPAGIIFVVIGMIFVKKAKERVKETEK